MLKHEDEKAWGDAIIEARTILIECARNQKSITYSALCNKLISIKVHPHTEIGFLLEDVSLEAIKCGFGLLSVLVVHKEGDMMPGQGFFDLGKKMGYDTSDKLKFWVEQMNEVFRIWKER